MLQSSATTISMDVHIYITSYEEQKPLFPGGCPRTDTIPNVLTNLGINGPSTLHISTIFSHQPSSFGQGFRPSRQPNIWIWQ